MLAVVFTVAGIATVFAQGLDGREGLRQPGALAVVTVVLTSAPVALRRRVPLPALLVSIAAIAAHILAHWPEGSLPLAVLFLTYSVGAWCPLRTAVVGLVTAEAVIVALGAAGSMGLEAVDIFGIVAQFAAAWAVGVAVRNHRAATDARVREASERAEVERQSTARRVAEERLRIARELHDIVAHSLSVVAVQAGVGAQCSTSVPTRAGRARRHLLHVAGTLAELRRLLGVLRDTDGARSDEPAPGLDELPGLVADVRGRRARDAARRGRRAGGQPGIELSAYRIVQEALTNVIKHAESPSRVDVIVRHRPGAIALEVVDDGGGDDTDVASSNGHGHGVVGMRERVGLWGGELYAGPLSRRRLPRRRVAAVPERRMMAFPGHAGRCWPLLGWRLVARTLTTVLT